MNNEYLTEAQAAEKLGYTGAVTADFATTTWCLDMGARLDLLEKYANWDFPATDDIVPNIEQFQITMTVSGYEGSATPAVYSLNVYYSERT